MLPILTDTHGERSADRCTGHREACNEVSLGDRRALRCRLQYFALEQVRPKCRQYFYSPMLWHAEKMTKLLVMASLVGEI